MTLSNQIIPISKLLEASYMDNTTADVFFTFKVDNDLCERVPAHKHLLKCRSTIFSSMFYGESTGEGDVEINNTTPESFKQFLKAFYFDELDIQLIYMFDVLSLARKYNVPTCTASCGEILKKSLNVKNLLWTYELVLEFNIVDLRMCCEWKIAANACQLFQSADFWDIDYETLLHIMSINAFTCTEYEIFSACLSWARKECHRQGIECDIAENVRCQLGEIFHKFRFRSMKRDELGEILKKYHYLFTYDELTELAILGLSNCNLQTLNNNHRERMWIGKNILKCNTILRMPMTVRQQEESVIFSSNTEVLLGEIYLRSIFSKAVIPFTPIPEHNFNLKLEVAEMCDSEKKMIKFTTKSKQLNFGSWFEFTPTILIKPHVKYLVQLVYEDLLHQNHYYSLTREKKSMYKFRNGIQINMNEEGGLLANFRFCTFP